MSATVRIAAGVCNQTPNDFKGNLARLKTVLQEAKAQGVALFCTQEMAITAYGCEDLYFMPHFIQQAADGLLSLLPECKGITAIIGLPVYFQGLLYNACAVVVDGKLCAVVPKKILPREGVHYEARWFTPGRRGYQSEIQIGQFTVPFGDMRFIQGNISFALEICEEAWTKDMGAAQHAAAGAQIIFNPSASHFALDKYNTRLRLVQEASRAMQVCHMHINGLGNESGRIIYDGGVIVAQSGQIISQSERFGFVDQRLHCVDVSIETLKAQHMRQTAVTHPDEQRSYGSATLHLPQVATKVAVTPLKKNEKIFFAAVGPVKALSAEEEFLAATTLGLWDYLRKSRAKGFALSLSGGCDSSVVAVLVAQMVHLSVMQLGAEGVCRKLGIGKTNGSDSAAASELVKRLLATVYQATAHSGQVTRQAADAVAAAVGADHHAVEVDDVIQAYTQKIAKHLGRSLQWDKDDVALQNIQARARAPYIWLLANVRQALLLTTSNRSEAAVGYATMDGDTAGGLAPISGVSKEFLRRWLVWAEKHCTMGLGAIPALNMVNVQAPTAELRPVTQTDEQDLMPYSLLQAIEKLYVEDKLSPQLVFRQLQLQFPDEAATYLEQMLSKFLRLWQSGQWKRDRYAPGFHLDSYSLDPKGWLRWPILAENSPDLTI